jgi:hypothetical protein
VTRFGLRELHRTSNLERFAALAKGYPLGVAARKTSARKYGAKAQRKVERVMHEMKRGELKSGRSGKKVTSRKQAIAIGLSEARKEGAKVPTRRASTRKKTSSRKKAARKKS